MKLKAYDNQKKASKDKEVKSKKKKQKQKPDNSLGNSGFKFSLNLKVSDNYKGSSDNIAGLISGLPEPIKQLCDNAKLVRTVVNHNYSHFYLSNNLNIRLSEKKIGNKRVKTVIIKQKSKELYNGIYK